MKRFELILTEDMALAKGKTLSWLLIYHVSRGWTLAETCFTGATKSYRIIK